MSEYIVADEFGLLGKWQPRLPELIRCRDCAKADVAIVRAWDGDEAARSLLCTRFGSFNHTTEPDGFCHAAERRP